MREVAVKDENGLGAEVLASLNDSGYAALSYVDSRVSGDGEVVLEGSVPTYHLKQLAQAVAQRVAGVRRIENRLAVCWSGEFARAAK